MCLIMLASIIVTYPDGSHWLHAYNDNAQRPRIWYAEVTTLDATEEKAHLRRRMEDYYCGDVST